MNLSHWILVFAWIIYYAIHSILASSWVKASFCNRWHRAYRYYRLTYSLLATAGLAWLLAYQYSFKSPILFEIGWLKYISLGILVVPGIIIIGLSIKKYFLLLSGIRSIFLATPPVALKVTGIHRFVRHPLYCGTLLFVWGLFIIFPMLNNLLAVLLLTLYVWVGIGFEEKKLVKEFGKRYVDYMALVPKLIPGFKSNP